MSVLSARRFDVTTRYSETVMDHFLEPRNQGAILCPSGTGISGAPGQGPFLIFQIVCRSGKVVQAGFQSHSCGITVACGSLLTETVLHRTLEECEEITAEDLVAWLDGIPQDKLHVPVSTLSALRQAVREASSR